MKLSNITIITAVIVIIFIYSTIFVMKKTCLESYEYYQPQWGIFTGCRIIVDGKLTPVNIVRELK